MSLRVVWVGDSAQFLIFFPHGKVAELGAGGVGGSEEGWVMSELINQVFFHFYLVNQVLRP